MLFQTQQIKTCNPNNLKHVALCEFKKEEPQTTNLSGVAVDIHIIQDEPVQTSTTKVILPLTAIIGS